MRRRFRRLWHTPETKGKIFFLAWLDLGVYTEEEFRLILTLAWYLEVLPKKIWLLWLLSCLRFVKWKYYAMHDIT